VNDLPLGARKPQRFTNIYNEQYNCNIADASSGTKTAHPSGTPAFIQSFSVVLVAQSLCFVNRYLSFCPLSVHGVKCRMIFVKLARYDKMNLLI
jgi:hypothetical protein